MFNMKALRTEITNTLHTPIAIIERNELYFSSPFHYHPEFELVYIKQGAGKRIIGDNLSPFTAGDMVFIGANLPHVWLSDRQSGTEHPPLPANAIVVYFNKDIFSPGFYELTEVACINELFARASRGISIEGRSQKKIAVKLEQLAARKGFDRFVGLMEILHLLANATDTRYIACEGYYMSRPGKTADRLAEVYQYISDNFCKDIALEDIARIADLTPSAFCRLFKKKTGRHFVSYLNAVRISYACKYLFETDRSIGEIAHQCGYKTISNFNKIFKKITGLSPRGYRISPQV